MEGTPLDTEAEMMRVYGEQRANPLSIKRIVFLDFIHRLVSQKQTKLKKTIKNYRQNIKT
jgi:replication-associated recombination protein RarA